MFETCDFNDSSPFINVVDQPLILTSGFRDSFCSLNQFVDKGSRVLPLVCSSNFNILKVWHLFSLWIFKWAASSPMGLQSPQTKRACLDRGMQCYAPSNMAARIFKSLAKNRDFLAIKRRCHFVYVMSWCNLDRFWTDFRNYGPCFKWRSIVLWLRFVR